MRVEPCICHPCREHNGIEVKMVNQWSVGGMRQDTCPECGLTVTWGGV